MATILSGCQCVEKWLAKIHHAICLIFQDRILKDHICSLPQLFQMFWRCAIESAFYHTAHTYLEILRAHCNVLFYTHLQKWKRAHMILINDLWITYRSKGNLVSITMSEFREVLVRQTEVVLIKKYQHHQGMSNSCLFIIPHHLNPGNPYAQSSSKI